MALMTVNDDDTEDARSKRDGRRQEAGRGPAPAAGREARRLSREVGIEAHRIAAWRDDFLSGGEEALKGPQGR